MSDTETAGGAQVPCISLLSEAFMGRAYELSDIATWLELQGKTDLGHECRNLAAKVYELGIKRHTDNVPGEAALPGERKL